MNRMAAYLLIATVGGVFAASPAHAGWWETVKKKTREAVDAAKKAVRKVGKQTKPQPSSLRRKFGRALRRLSSVMKGALSRAGKRLVAGRAPGGPVKKGTALVVCIENANKSPFFDKALESAAALQMSNFAKRYENSAILKNCTTDSLKSALVRFRGLRTDVATLVHGNQHYMLMNDRIFTKRDIADLRWYRPTLGVVFQLNCWGSHLNEAWLQAGAKAVTGTRKLNSRVQAYLSFFRSWTAGKPFREAVKAANSKGNLIQRFNVLGSRIGKKIASACCGAAAARSVCGRFGPAKVREAFCRHNATPASDVDPTFLLAGDGDARF